MNFKPSFRQPSENRSVARTFLYLVSSLTLALFLLGGVVTAAVPEFVTSALQAEFEDSTRGTGEGTRLRIEHTDTGKAVEIAIEGKVAFSSDYTSIKKIGRKSRVSLTAKSRGERRVQVLITGSPEGPIFEYRIGRTVHPFDAKAQKWFWGLLGETLGESDVSLKQHNH